MKLKLVPVLVGLGLCSVGRAEVHEKTFAEYCRWAVTRAPEHASLDALARLVSVRTPVEAASCEFLEGALAEQTRFLLRGKNLSSLKAFTYLPQTTEIVASRNEIKSLIGLEGLTKLETLDLGSNQIEDLSALKNLTGIKILRLAGNSISDISALGGLVHLSDLSLASNKIADLKPLAKVETIQYLNLSGNSLTSLEGLESLTQLRVLNIGFNNICESGFIAEAEKKGVTLIGQDNQACRR